MDLVDLTETLVKALVKDKEAVSVKELEIEEDYILIQVLTNKENMGAIIGRRGNIANSIRTIVQAASYLHENKKVKINIDSI
ncbi:MAG: KH domain-containing protein [Bacilli bacterium]|jgi:predicted RNA-binding protein YlqC (UPF0109 family)